MNGDGSESDEAAAATAAMMSVMVLWMMMVMNSQLVPLLVLLVLYLQPSCNLEHTWAAEDMDLGMRSSSSVPGLLHDKVETRFVCSGSKTVCI